MGYGIWDMGWDMGHGIWDGIWDWDWVGFLLISKPHPPIPNGLGDCPISHSMGGKYNGDYPTVG